MVIVLDGYFTHRGRAIEGKDGNPLNEVRVAASSLMGNKGLIGSDSTIKMNPATSVLKLKVGEPIRLTEKEFVRLYKAFFTEIETKFWSSHMRLK